MSMTMKCTCGKLLEVDEHHRGQQAQCPSCGSLFVPGASNNSTTAFQAETPIGKAAIASPTAMQAEMPIGKVAGPEASTQSKSMSEQGPIITRSWLSPALGWVLMFVIFACIGAGVLGYFLAQPMVFTTRYAASLTVKGSLTHACQAYFRDHNRFPDNLGELLKKDALGGPYLEGPDALVDPWGNQFQYDPKGPRNNGAKPDIWTIDPGDGALIGNWPKGR
jgi:hypothetical protein